MSKKTEILKLDYPKNVDFKIKFEENITKLWFIKWHKGRPIITLNDFKKLTGIDLLTLKPFFREEYFSAGIDWNGLGQGALREEFERINNVHYEEETFIYMYASGITKALIILENYGCFKSIKKYNVIKECYTMRKSNEEKPMSMIEFVQVVKEFTPSQIKALDNLINAFLEFQDEIKKDSNVVGDKDC